MTAMFPNKDNGKPKLVISTYDDLNNPYYGGGGARATHEVAKRLNKYFNVIVITGNYPAAQNAVYDQVFYYRVGNPNLGPKISQLLFHFHLIDLVRKLDFDIWLEGFTPPFSTSFLPLFTNKPVTGLAHMLCGEDMRRKYLFPFTIIESLGLKTYQNVIVASDTFQQKIIKANPRINTTVIPYGTSITTKYIKTRTKNQLLYIGRLEYNQKGVDLLLDSFSLASRQIPHKLIIAGEGDAASLAQIKNKITTEKLENRVQLVGKVNEVEKEFLFRQSAAVILPSRFETFSLVALEALSYGKPLICFDIDGLSWVPANCSLKAPPYDPKIMSQQIINLLVSKQLQDQISLASTQFSKEFTWDTTADRYFQFLNDSSKKHYERLNPQLNFEK